MRFDKFTTKFQQALADAQSRALGQDNPYIEPVHVLAAMLDEEDGGTRSLMQRAGTNVAGLKAALDKATEAQKDTWDLDLRVEVVLGKNEVGGPFTARQPPGNLNWNLWQGQTPDVPYIAERSHYTFRWWHEYSGGQMTDWGAHHIDIAQWGINSLPIKFRGQGRPATTANGYNVPLDFSAEVEFENGVVMTIGDTGRNGILFTGTAGRIFVNRGTLDGTPVEQLATNPLARESYQAYSGDNLSRPERSGKLDAIINHMGNFFDCVESRRQPLSDVESQHRSISTCHLADPLYPIRLASNS